MAKDQNKSVMQHNYECRAIKDWPESERPREKLLQLGPEGLSDGELLAVLLRIGATGQSAEDLGRKLRSLKLPLPPLHIQEKILQQINIKKQESLDLNIMAKNLLEKAIISVEQMILGVKSVENI